jgi:hypothetical protein
MWLWQVMRTIASSASSQLKYQEIDMARKFICATAAVLITGLMTVMVSIVAVHSHSARSTVTQTASVDGALKVSAG